MKSAWVIVPALAVATTACALGYHIYDTRHISSDLRRTLIAASNPDCSEADEIVYLQSARTEIRTKRDAELAADLQSAVKDIIVAEEAKQRSLELIREGHMLDDSYTRASQVQDSGTDSALRTFDIIRAELGVTTVKH